MNYLNVYNRLISVKKTENRKKGNGVYYEKHHIIPRWLGGKDTKDNLILLTPKEHFIAHMLLWKHYRDRSSALAFHRMTLSNNTKQHRIFTSTQFEKARIAFVETQLGDKNWVRINGSPNKGKVSKSKGTKRPEMSVRMSGDNNPSKLPGVGEKISNALKGRKKTADHIKNIQIGLTPEIRKMRSQKIWETRRKNALLKNRNIL